MQTSDRDQLAGRSALRPAQSRITPARPSGAPLGEVYFLFSASEFHRGNDDQGRPVADLIVPTADWRSRLNLRLMAGVRSEPSSSARVLVVEVDGVLQNHSCPPPSESGIAWSAAVNLPEVGSHLAMAVYLPGGNLDEFGGILITDEPDFVPKPSMRFEDSLDALFTDITGRTSLSPKAVEAGDIALLNGTYAVGRYGLAIGQRIEFLVPDNGWSEPQIREGTGEGFLTIHNTGRARAEIDRVAPPGSPDYPDYWRIQVVIGAAEMRPGDIMTISYGDRSRKGPGARIPVVPQTMDGRPPRSRTKLFPPLTAVFDRFDIGRPRPPAIAHRHSIAVTPGETAKFFVAAPSHALLGQPVTVNVVAVDRYNNPSVPAFKGSVRVEFDGAPDTPALRESFGGTDRGAKAVVWTPQYKGPVRVMVDDTTGRKGASNPILCLDAAPAETIYWGDLHCHSRISGGLESVANTLAYARDVAFLDFCCVSDFANLMSDREWAEAQRETNRANADGEFVALVGYQWGDDAQDPARRQLGRRTILASGDSLPLIKGVRKDSSLAAVFETMRKLPGDVLAFANHPLQDASWEQFQPDIEAAVEIYSSYGSSERRGEVRSRAAAGQGISVEEILATGSRVAFVATGDGYEGRPGLSPEAAAVRTLHPWRPYSGGLTAVIADDLTREAILSAIKRRKVYCTTGHRSILEFYLNDASMGDVVELGPGERRQFAVRIVADGDLRKVEIIRNGEPAVSQGAVSTVHALNWEDRKPSQGPDYYYLRVTSWDGGLAWTSPIWVVPKGWTDRARATPAGQPRAVGALRGPGLGPRP